MKYESTFNAIDKILRNEAGCSNELDYIEQTSWLLFLKYLDDLESELEINAQFDGKTYKRIVTGFNRWGSWAAPKTAKNELDVINAMTGDDLVRFVNEKLFPQLAKFKETATETSSLEYKIGEIFSELRNKIQSGYNLREIINKIDSLKFSSADDKHEMTVLYEDKIRRMGNAGRNGGEYYTPRPLIRSIIKVVDPQIGDTIYDPACGSAGFLCEAYNYMLEKKKSASDYDTLQKKTFYGKEKKPLPYIIATMNMIFHGIKAPNITRGNTLSENLSQIQEKDRHSVILANPPFGGSERQDVQQNFAIKTSETAYMFMQHFVKMLKAGGRAGIVIKNTILDDASGIEIRKMLIEDCNLHSILVLPRGVFQGASVDTVVLFFDKGSKTKNIWYYQLSPSRTLGKTNPLTESDLEDFVALQKSRAITDRSWIIDVDDLDSNLNLKAQNPNAKKDFSRGKCESLINAASIAAQKAADLLAQLKQDTDVFQSSFNEALSPKTGWKVSKLEDICTFISRGKSPKYSDIRKYPVLAQKCNQWEGISLDKALFLDPNTIDKWKKHYYLQDEDVIVNSTGTGSVGRTGIFYKDLLGDYELIVPDSHITVIRVDKSIMLQKYLFYLTRTPAFAQYVEQHLVGSTNQKELYVKNLIGFELSYPSIEEQRIIVAYLDKLSEILKETELRMKEVSEICSQAYKSMSMQIFE